MAVIEGGWNARDANMRLAAPLDQSAIGVSA